MPLQPSRLTGELCLLFIQMETFLSAILSDLATRSLSFLINKCSKPTSPTMEEKLQRLLLRVQIILEEAEDRLIANQAMQQQLNILRKEMYRGCYSKLPLLSNEEKIQRLERMLLRLAAAIEEADGRRILNHGMLRHINMLRQDMHKGYYALDTFRIQKHQEEDMNDDDGNELPDSAVIDVVRHEGRRKRASPVVVQQRKSTLIQWWCRPDLETSVATVARVLPTIGSMDGDASSPPMSALDPDYIVTYGDIFVCNFE
uniref:Rx N-terminal domain-containing protein n=1 Tax=Oryza nivara TaxID=4536 RepID=A0A0E0HW14_ORYNI